MIEQEDGEKSQTAEELKQELLESLKDADFGTPKFSALADWLNLDKHELRLHELREEISLSSGSPQNKRFRESQLRVEELHFAFLEHKIENSRSTIPGYAAAYSHINGSVDDFLTMLSCEQDKNSVENYYIDGLSALRSDLWEEYFEKEG
jgi:hypothetical protein